MLELLFVANGAVIVVSEYCIVFLVDIYTVGYRRRHDDNPLILFIVYFCFVLRLRVDHQDVVIADLFLDQHLSNILGIRFRVAADVDALAFLRVLYDQFQYSAFIYEFGGF